MLLCNIDTPTMAKPFYFMKIRLINTGPRVIRIPILSKSDTMPVLNIFKILTNLDEYIIAIGGVVDGMALDIEAAKAAAIMGGMGLNPAPTARDAATGHIITAEAVLEAAYDITKPIIALIAKILNSVRLVSV